MTAHLGVLCGQIVVVGLAGPELSPTERRSLERGERGGVILFKRNIREDASAPDGIRALTRSIVEAASSATALAAGAPHAPPLVAVDQEGGRVVRIGPPALPLPAMRKIGDLGDVAFAERLAEAQARELAAMGFTMSFAPVADTHTRADNPVIGERSFATTPEAVARFAGAWARGLRRGGVLSCAKHFPGHGDTTVDSHFALPRVERSREELDKIEIAAFRALVTEPALTAMMSAHVVYPALDPDRPATLSPTILTGLLRKTLGFEGMLFSDDMEMKAISLPIGEAVVRAVTAGVDAPLVCHGEDLAAEAHAALVREAETSPAFRARCEEARLRFVRTRERVTYRPAADADELARAFDASRSIVDELEARLAALSDRSTAGSGRVLS